MRERAAELLGAAGQGDARRRRHDLHVPCARASRSSAATPHALGLKPGFSILDPGDIEPIVAELMQTTDRARARAAQWRISAWKNALVSPAAAAKAAQSDDERGRGAGLPPLRRHAARLPGGRFRRPDRAAGRAPRDATQAAAAKWRERCGYLLVDEYQDTNPAQYRLLRLLVGERARVHRGRRRRPGDLRLARRLARQPRAAAAATIPALKVVKLEQNYRSTVRILRSANALIANNPKLFDKKLWSERGHGDPIRVSPAADDEAEAEGVVRRLLAHRFEHRGRYADYAILYRGNHQAKLFEQQLRAQNVPYEISGGQSYFERAEIKDIVAYLRLIANDDDDPAFIRAVTTPKRGVGATTLERLGAIGGARHESLFAAVFADETRAAIPARQREILDAFCTLINGLRYRAAREPAARLLDELVAAIGYEDFLAASCERKQAEARWQSVRDFVGWLSAKGEADRKNLLELTQMIALITMLEGQEASAIGCGAAVDAARGEGPRVPARVPGRAGGGPAAAPRVGRERQRRRGAAAVVRRHHARAAQPAPVVLPPAQARGRDGRMPAVALPRRARAGRPALGRRAAARRRGGAREGGRQRAAEAAEGDARGEVARGRTRH